MELHNLESKQVVSPIENAWKFAREDLEIGGRDIFNTAPNINSIATAI